VGVNLAARRIDFELAFVRQFEYESTSGASFAIAFVLEKQTMRSLNATLRIDETKKAHANCPKFH
jgi:hypothetical protein